MDPLGLRRLMYGPTLSPIFALLGQPVIGNPTQYMIEEALADRGLQGQYLTIEVSPGELAGAIQGIRSLHFAGVHITIPHKESVTPFLDQVTEAARLIGAVNCLFWRRGNLVGENTDGKGFLRSLEIVRAPKGLETVILGAGGAARAIAVELALAGAKEISIVNRNPERGKKLSDLIRNLGVNSRYVPWEDDYLPPSRVDLLVNATSLGLNQPGQRVPVNFSQLTPKTLVADVVFNPLMTQFLFDAHEAGLQIVDGLGMLVKQAAIAFKIWLGVDPDENVMLAAITQALAVAE